MKQQGILRLNHVTDTILKNAVSEVVVVKPAYYYHTWISAAKIKESGTLRIESPLEDPEYKVPMVSGTPHPSSNCGDTTSEPFLVLTMNR